MNSPEDDNLSLDNEEKDDESQESKLMCSKCRNIFFFRFSICKQTVNHL